MGSGWLSLQEVICIMDKEGEEGGVLWNVPSRSVGWNQDRILHTGNGESTWEKSIISIRCSPEQAA